MITSISKQFLLFSVNRKSKLSSIKNHKELFVAICLMELLYKKYIIIKDKKVYIERELTNEVMHIKSLYDYIKNSKPLNEAAIIWRYVYSFSNKNFNELYNSVLFSLKVEGEASSKEDYYKSEKNRLVDEIKKYDSFSSENDKSIIILSLCLLKGYLLKGHIDKKDISNLRKVLKKFKEEYYTKVIIEITKIDVATLLLSSISI